jgi:nitric oxide reductase large subunit
MVLSFSVLLYFGKKIYRQAPPVPLKVTTPDGSYSVLPIGLAQTVASVKEAGALRRNSTQSA